MPGEQRVGLMVARAARRNRRSPGGLVGPLVAAVLLAACGSGTASPPSTAPAGPAASAAPGVVAFPALVASPSPALAASSPVASSPVAPGQLAQINASYTEVSAPELPRVIADDQGFFAAHGVQLNETAIPGTNGIAAVVAGQVDLAIAGGSQALSAAAGGADLSVVAVITPKYYFVMMAAPQIHALADLKGKKIGIPTPGSSSDISSRIVLQRAGLNPDQDVTFIPVGSPTQQLSALLSGATDAAPLTPPDDVTAQEAGYNDVQDMSPLDIAAAVSTVTVRKSWAAANRSTLQGYVDSIVQGIAFAKNNKDLAMQIMHKYIQYPDPAMYDDAYNYYFGAADPVIPNQPLPRPDQFTDSQTQLASTNANIASFDLSQLLDPSFVQSAIDRGLDK